jgi:FMN-dependent oxidoreductase (nitrilotriacetate monooxygenase family)
MTTRAPSLKLVAHTALLAYETAHRRHAWERDAEDGSFELIVARARAVEEKGFDGVFFGDAPYLSRETLASNGTFPYEPFTLLSALAARTERLGLIATVATQYNDPYNLARRIASLDYISGGRAGWNAVTGFLGETNFGFKEIVPPQERYQRAEEFVDVVLQLWRSWKPGYLQPDAAEQRYYDADKIQDINFHGQYFDVEQASTIPPSAQGHPVLVQAGGSENGLELAGRFGELIYTAAPAFEQGRSQVAAYRANAESHGRARDSIKIVPGLYAYVGATLAEALENRAATVTDHDLLVQGIAAAKREYSGFSFDGLSLDDELRPEHLPTAEEIDRSARRRSRAQLFLGFAQRPQATLRSLLTEIVTGGGHTNVVGSYDQVAGELERWYRADAADGFVLMGTNSLAEFLGEIVPRLEQKEIFDSRPDLTTFRGRLGLPEVPVGAGSLVAA